jgi:hypothetical protein
MKLNFVQNAQPPVKVDEIIATTQKHVLAVINSCAVVVGAV